MEREEKSLTLKKNYIFWWKFKANKNGIELQRSRCSFVWFQFLINLPFWIKVKRQSWKDQHFQIEFTRGCELRHPIFPAFVCHEGFMHNLCVNNYASFLFVKAKFHRFRDAAASNLTRISLRNCLENQFRRMWKKSNENIYR